MREAFSIIDINNDGELDIDEMMQVVDKLKEQGICDPNLDEDKAQDMMDEVDQDGRCVTIYMTLFEPKQPIQ